MHFADFFNFKFFETYHIWKTIPLLVTDTNNSIQMRLFLFWGLCARYNDVLYFNFIWSENPVTKRTNTFLLQAFSSSYAKKEENVSLLLLRAASCFQIWQQNLSINENMKNSLKVKFWNKLFSQCQGLNQKFDKMPDFDLIFIQPVKT